MRERHKGEKYRRGRDLGIGMKWKRGEKMGDERGEKDKLK